jgi:hypothetical protein
MVHIDEEAAPMQGVKREDQVPAFKIDAVRYTISCCERQARYRYVSSYVRR